MPRLLSVALRLSLFALLATSTVAAGRKIAPARAGQGVAARAAAIASTALASAAPAEIAFDSTFSPLPPNVASLGFEANAAAEFGDSIGFVGDPGFLDSAEVTMSSWAIRSDFPGSAAAGFVHPLTLKLYAVDNSGPTPRPGALLAAITQNFTIPWRPEPDPSSTSPDRPWLASDGNYYTGLAFTVSFDLSGVSAILPAQLIYSVSFDTWHYGAHPRGVHGPYDSLNVAVSEATPSAGTDLETDVVYWTTVAGNYADGGAAGAGVFRRDTGWTPYKPAARFVTSARGSLHAALALLLAPPAPSTNVSIAAKLKSAATSLGAALTTRLWTSGNRPASDDAGETIFDLLGDAAENLAFVTTSSTSSTTASRSLDDELDAAARLAATALADAVVAGGNPGKLRHALSDWTDANAAAGRGRYRQAIEAYGDVWSGARDASR